MRLRVRTQFTCYGWMVEYKTKLFEAWKQVLYSSDADANNYSCFRQESVAEDRAIRIYEEGTL
jgi:hypothetical protein